MDGNWQSVTCPDRKRGGNAVTLSEFIKLVYDFIGMSTARFRYEVYIFSRSKGEGNYRDIR